MYLKDYSCICEDWFAGKTCNLTYVENIYAEITDPFRGVEGCSSCYLKWTRSCDVESESCVCIEGVTGQYCEINENEPPMVVYYNTTTVPITTTVEPGIEIDSNLYIAIVSGGIVFLWLLNKMRTNRIKVSQKKKARLETVKTSGNRKRKKKKANSEKSTHKKAVR